MTPIPCPSCHAPLPDRAAACPSCGLSLTGPAAVELWRVDQEIARLQGERAGLLRSLRTESAPTAPAPTPAPAPAPTTPTLAPSAPPTPTPSSPAPAPPTPAPTPAPVPSPPDHFGGLFAPPPGFPPHAGPPHAGPPHAGPPHADPPPPVSRRTPTLTGQRLLLVTGVALVLVAAVVFLAVSWSRIGVLGQVAVMALITILAGAASLRTSHRGLRSSAESLAVLASGLLLLDVFAARRLGLAGLDEVSARGYVGVTGLLAALVLAALHLSDRRIRAFAYLSLTAASIGVAGLAALAEGAVAFAAVALAASAGFGVMAVRLPARAGTLRTAAGGPTATWLFVAFVSASVVALTRPYAGLADAGEELTCVGLLAVIAVGGGFVVRRVVHHRRATSEDPAEPSTVGRDWLARLHTGRWRAISLIAATSTLAAIATVVGLGVQLGDAGTAILAAALILPIAVLCLDDHALTPGRRWAVGTAIAAQVCLVPVAGSSQVATGVVILTLAASAVVVAVARAGSRVLLLPLAVVLAVVSGSILVEPYGRLPTVLTLAGIGVVAVGVAGWRRSHPEEIGLGLVGGLTVVVGAAVSAVSWGGPADVTVTAAALTLVGVAGLGYAFLPARRPVVAVAVAGFTSALWVVLADRDVVTVEAYSFPLAALVLGADAWLRRPGTDRWRFVSRSLVFALVPSTSAAALSDGTARPLTTTAIAVALFALAHRRGWSVLAAVAAVAQVVLLIGALDDQRVLGLSALAAVVTLALLARSLPELRGGLVPAVVVFTGVGVGLLVEPAGTVPLVLALLVLGTAGVAAAGARRDEPEEWGTAGVGLLTLLVAAGSAWERDSVTLTVVALCVVGALAAAYAALPARRLVVLLAVGAFTAALWIALDAGGVEVVEAYSLPLAVFVLGAGLWLRPPDAPSWAFAGPAVVVGLVPSAMLSLTDDGVVRPLLTVVAGAVVLAVGVTLRWQALVLTGAAVTLLVGLSQLLPYAGRLPRWVTLALVGAVLLGLGIRYEGTRRGARRAVDWVGGLE